MKKYISQLFNLGTSPTAKNTYLLFAGNLLDAVLAFVFTLLIFRTLSTAEFGVFSALNNFVIVIYSLLDIGIAGSLINFISYHLSRNEPAVAQKFFRAGLFLRGIVAAVIALVVIASATFIGPKFFLTNQVWAIVWAGCAIFGLSLLDFSYYVFQAYQKFLSSAITSVSYSFFRVAIILTLIFVHSSFSLTVVMAIIGASPVIGVVVSLYKFRKSLKWEWPERLIVKKLLSFGGWMGITRIFSTITGRMDVQMVLLLMTPADAGVYSVATRLASFYSVAVTSFTAVLAPKFATGNDLSKLKSFVGKAALGVVGLVMAMGVGVLVAHPLILLLFGTRAINSVLPFQALTIAFIPFVASTLATTIIIYNLKQPRVMALLTFCQFFLVLGGNLVFIPRYGSLGPALTIGLTNIVTLLVSGWWVWRKWK